MTAEAPGRRPRVVIVGGGFGGLAAAQGLRDAAVEVTVIDRMNHHLFQPLLYQVAAGGLSMGECASAIREHLRGQANASVLMAEATDIDTEARQVVLDRGERVDYDRLIVACGGQTSYFGHDEWASVSFGLKTLRDAVELRTRIVTALEEAERATDPATRDGWLTFVVVGGGPTGVEIAGQLAILTHSTMTGRFARADPARARVIVVDAGERLVPAFSERLSARAAGELASLGVTIRERAKATAIDGDGVTIEVDGRSERIAAGTVVWAAGVHPAPFTGAVAQATGAETDRPGRIEVNDDLTVPGHPEIHAIGDIASLAGSDGKPLPGLATVAIQQAHHAARAIRSGAPSKPFHYLDKGALAVIGRGRAVCQVRRLELWGRPAFAMYLGVHLYYLSGVPGRRLRVLSAWTAARFGTRESWVADGALPPG